MMMVVDRFFSNEDMKKLLENNFSVNDRLIYDALVRTRLAPSDQDRAKAIREFLEKVGEKKKP
ncbi:MAG: hypothetical protein HYT12_02715 [Candidatus Liptonbacteria bacterium]|nr:hypothetical protein [Candidatus Liptonbacteria bacterium]